LNFRESKGSLEIEEFALQELKGMTMLMVAEEIQCIFCYICPRTVARNIFVALHVLESLSSCAAHKSDANSQCSKVKKLSVVLQFVWQ